MKRKAFFAPCLAVLLALILVFPPSAYADDGNENEESSICLLDYEGEIEIFSTSGKPRALADDGIFESGEALQTGEESRASVSLENGRTVCLDSNTRVTFIREGGHTRISLEEGSVFLDVQEKLAEDETLDIQTAAMTVDIRGTIVFISDIPTEPATELPAAAENAQDSAAENRQTTLGVLEGTAEIRYEDTEGANRVLPVPAGNKAVIPDVSNEAAASETAAVTPAVTNLVSDDIQGFVAELVNEDQALKERITNGSEQGELLLIPGGITDIAAKDLFPADGDWTWNGQVTLVAQSAGKLYDGTPLARPSGVLVYGLPGEFNINVAASGSQTDAGQSENAIGSYTIFNSAGENVTGHFTNIEKINGMLRVDPAPLVVWTGSAEKEYDGTELTCEEAGIRTVPGYVSKVADYSSEQVTMVDTPAWANTSLVTQTALGSERIIGISGRTFIYGMNPLTGETKALELPAGQSLVAALHNDGEKQSLEFVTAALTEEELPEEMLRLYADNPELLARACEETGWDPEKMAELIAALPESDGDIVVSKNDLQVAGSVRDCLMTDSACLRLQLAAGGTNYSSRPLDEDEAHFVPVVLDPSISVKATGSQTEAGESVNTYEIDWGSANPNNYVLQEDLGTLTVLPLPDSTPAPTPNPTPAPTPKPTPAPTPKPTPTPAPTPIAVTVAIKGIKDSRVFSGEEIFVEGYEVSVSDSRYTEAFIAFSGTAAASGLNIGTYTMGLTAEQFTNTNAGFNVTFTVTDGELEITKLPVTVTITGNSGTAEYNGEEHAVEGYTVEISNSLYTEEDFIFTGESAEAGGVIPGEYTMGLTADMFENKNDNFDVTFTVTDGVLEVTKNTSPITITAATAEKTYDGTALTADETIVEGLPDNDLFWAYGNTEGSQTDFGSCENKVVDYVIGDREENDVTEYFDNVTLVDGTLTVKKRTVTLTSADVEKFYDEEPLTNGDNGIIEGGDGFAEGEGASYTFTGSQTNMGQSPNTFEYTLKGNTKAENYDITVTYGILYVKQRYIIETEVDDPPVIIDTGVN